MPTVLVRPGLGRLGRLGAARGSLASELRAGALRHVPPFVGQVVLGGLAGARMARRAAIVLPRLGDAVAFFLRAALGVLGIGRLGHAEREHAGDSRLQYLVAGGHRASFLSRILSVS